MIHHHRRAVVEHVAQHHGGDDAEDEEPLAAQRHALLWANHAVVDEHRRAQEHQDGERVLQERVALPEHRVRPEHEQVEARVEAAAPQNEAAREEHTEAEEDQLMRDAEKGANATISVDLEAQEIRGPDGGMIKFEIDGFRRHCLLNGLDDIGLTMEKAPAIDSFEKRNAESRPWA